MHTCLQEWMNMDKKFKKLQKVEEKLLKSMLTKWLKKQKKYGV